MEVVVQKGGSKEAIMKEFSRKALALALALVLVFALAACGPKGSDDLGPTDPPAPTDPLDVDGMGVDFLPDNEVDVAQKILGFPGSTALLTVNGVEVSAEEYLYWLGNMTAYYEMMYTYTGGGVLNLDDELSEGLTWGEQLKEIAYQNSVLLAITPEAAAQYGVTLSEDDLAELINQRENNIQNAGGKEQYAYQLQAMGINDRAAFRLDQVSALFNSLQEVYVEKALHGDGAEAITAQEMAAYLEENGILRAKHILLLTKDMETGEEYDDATKAQQRAKAEDILSQLRADPTKFDALMNEHSEDTGLTTYPDGYLFGEGDMVAAFENGTKALEVGEISDIIESEFGYHIILRLDADCDESREECAVQKFNDMMSDRVDNAVVEKMAEYDSITTKEYYTALTEFQQSLEAPTVVDDMSDATLEPAPEE